MGEGGGLLNHWSKLKLNTTSHYVPWNIQLISNYSKSNSVVTEYYINKQWEYISNTHICVCYTDVLLHGNTYTQFFKLHSNGQADKKINVPL